ncbi:enoyl-CoA hydratase/isomerase family protein [Phenylobacterium sp. SCN 70-31]|uniref:enoyl-CoA hydratase/isomerase family protein n=1 Tax=Phenylobacterium sp. SCN 70-31 TaxID=1660129 RepID=UPI000ADD3D7F|nr:enoyl-CoA hydratase/isomerase family protein [Phenylobacterium sp. SCN 70-31]
MTEIVEAAPPVLAERRGAVAVVTLNRPAARNALNRALLAALHEHLHAAMEDDSVRAVVLTGAGPAFCAGADLREALDTPPGAEGFWLQYDRSGQSLDLHRLLPRLPKPVIAAVNGFALGGGCGVAMSCDLVIASDQATFGYPEVAQGLVAAMVMVSLSRIVGRRQALDLLLTGRKLTAADALGLGLVNRVAPHGDLLDQAVAYAEEVAQHSAQALRMTKSLYYNVAELDLDRALDYARDFNQMLRQTKPAAGGAFAAKARS